MATCSNILAWKIPWREEPGGLQSMRLQSIRREGTHTQIHSTKRVPASYEAARKCTLHAYTHPPTDLKSQSNRQITAMMPQWFWMMATVIRSNQMEIVNPGRLPEGNSLWTVFRKIWVKLSSVLGLLPDSETRQNPNTRLPSSGWQRENSCPFSHLGLNDWISQ